MVMAIWAPLNKFSQVPLDQNPPPPHLRHPVQWHHSELRRRETSGPALGWNWEPKKHQKRLTRRMKTMVRVLPRMFVLSRKESRKKTMVRVLARMFLLLRKESRMKIFWLKLGCISPKYPMDHWRKPKKKTNYVLEAPCWYDRQDIHRLCRRNPWSPYEMPSYVIASDPCFPVPSVLFEIFWLFVLRKVPFHVYICNTEVYELPMTQIGSYIFHSGWRKAWGRKECCKGGGGLDHETQEYSQPGIQQQEVGMQKWGYVAWGMPCWSS